MAAAPLDMRPTDDPVSFRSVADWNTRVTPPASSRAAAAVSLSIWLGVICCGRLIAYL